MVALFSFAARQRESTANAAFDADCRVPSLHRARFGAYTTGGLGAEALTTPYDPWVIRSSSSRTWRRWVWRGHIWLLVYAVEKMVKPYRWRTVAIRCGGNDGK